jgi:hypothetical protein
MKESCPRLIASVGEGSDQGFVTILYLQDIDMPSHVPRNINMAFAFIS